MQKINLKTETVSMEGEDLTPFIKIAEAINSFGKILIQIIPDTNLDDIRTIHKYGKAISRVAGDLLVIEDAEKSNKSWFFGLHLYMALFDEYDIREDVVYLHNKYNFETTCFRKEN